MSRSKSSIEHAEQQLLSAHELQQINAYWRACNYLAAGMIYLRDNPLLKLPLKPEHIKQRLLGHWGSSPGLSFAYIHINRLIKKYGLNAIFLAGPGHGAPAVSYTHLDVYKRQAQYWEDAVKELRERAEIEADQESG